MPDHAGVPWGYFDHAATSPLRPEVRACLKDALDQAGWGNPSSAHAAGRAASRLIEEAREHVATSLGGDPRRLTFYSGATEANHAGLMALGQWAREKGDVVILSSPIEHPSVLGALHRLQAQGFRIHWAEVNDHGQVEAEISGMVKSIRPSFLVCMAANNETGVIQPWKRWAEIGLAAGCPIHVDATQWWGKWSSRNDLPALGNWVVSGHKRGALSGAGAMHSAGFPLEGWLGDGPQERGRRGGTENLLGLLALGEVARLGVDVDPHWTRLLESTLQDVPGLQITGASADRLPSHLHLRLPVRADVVLQRLDLEGFAVSSGSACSSGSLQPSRVLLAMGWSEEQARRALRVSTGWTNGHEDVTAFAVALKDVLVDLQSYARGADSAS